MQKLLSSLGPVCAVIGAQWGDEGKGKVVDILAEHFDVVARACGGANAGHTIMIQGKKHVFNLLPSGCFHEGVPVILGSGMVIHLPTLLKEIATLRTHNIDIVPRLWISREAHIVFDYHKEIDAVLEQRRSDAKGEGIGTTKRGIGPAYMDKAARSGIRMEMLGDDLHKELQHHAKELHSLYGVTVNVEQELAQLKEAQNLLSSQITDTVSMLHQHLEAGERILIEGAQATLLDIDHGTYPYVTSSSTTSAGALQGLGLPPRALTSCIGVAKAYCTRVGGGPFATEMPEDIGHRIRERGGEYGATTGRPRRCGWIHLPDLLYSARLNGITGWNITKLDVLDDEPVIQVGIGTKTDGSAVYEEIPGWQTSTRGLTDAKKLPKEAKKLMDLIEEYTKVPVQLIGTGQGREEIIVR